MVGLVARCLYIPAPRWDKTLVRSVPQRPSCCAWENRCHKAMLHTF